MPVNDVRNVVRPSVAHQGEGHRALKNIDPTVVVGVILRLDYIVRMDLARPLDGMLEVCGDSSRTSHVGWLVASVTWAFRQHTFSSCTHGSLIILARWKMGLRLG